jgi:Mg2+-importing ATPase
MINYLPMLPLQLLLLDLIADFPLIAISTDSVNHYELKKPLQYSMKNVLLVTFIFSLVNSPFDFLVFAIFKANAPVLQTNWFIASVWSQLILIFSLRTKQPFWRAHLPSLSLSLFCLLAAVIAGVLPYTSFGHRFFHFISPTMRDLGIIAAIVGVYFITNEAVKLLYYRVRSRE